MLLLLMIVFPLKQQKDMSLAFRDINLQESIVVGWC